MKRFIFIKTMAVAHCHPEVKEYYDWKSVGIDVFQIPNPDPPHTPINFLPKASELPIDVPPQGLGARERLTDRIRILGIDVTVQVRTPEDNPSCTVRFAAGLDHHPRYILGPGLDPVYQTRFTDVDDSFLGAGTGASSPMAAHIPFEDPPQAEIGRAHV